MITDAQVHVWKRVADESRRHRAEPFGPDELVAWIAEAGVDRAVLVPPTWAADGNEVALLGARRYPDRFRVMGLVELERPESRERIASWRSDPAMAGIRISMHTGVNRQMFLDGALEWLWTAAAASGVPVMVYPPGLIEEIGAVARHHPGLRLVIDHLGAALERRATAVDEAAAKLLELAPLENVSVKVSALPWYSCAPYPFEDLHETVRRVVHAFGPRRSFWGTDVTRLPCSYREARSMMAVALKDLGPSDLDLVMGRAICECLGWPA